jgi:ParB-like chromosome segregation protein Spo0J
MPVKPAFQSDTVTINVADIIPIKTITAAYRKTDTYRRISASMQHLGIIEPPVVFPAAKGKYLLLDGHTRLDILTETNVMTVECLLATDNESYTYNKRVNHIPPIAQHHMILRALAHVSEEKIAMALNTSVTAIRDKRDLLNGICPETAEILQNSKVSAAAFAALRKMKPVRQIDVARLMISAQKFSGRFARALLDGTREEFLLPTPRPRLRATPNEQAILEQETDDLLQHVRSIQENYGNDVRTLTASCRYAERVLGNVRVRRYLGKNHVDTLAALDHLLVEIAADKQRRPPAKAKASSSGKKASAA